MKLGIDRLLQDRKLWKKLVGRKLGIIAHPASVTAKGLHTMDALMALEKLDVVCAFGPQHGMRGEKQDNMVESQDYLDPLWKIPVFSLYGEVRRPTSDMMNRLDVVLVDLQDIGTRIYTFVTTLRYMLEECARYQKAIWVLDRPNPSGRPIEGSILEKGWESFVGPGPMVMRHGLTMGEMASWLVRQGKLDVELDVVPMEAYRPQDPPEYGWPAKNLMWVNPSPNIPSFQVTRSYPGSVLLEGTTLSEGRGTTRPFEIIGAPNLDVPAVVKEMRKLEPSWLQGFRLRPCFFEPTFHKHAGRLCHGVQIHVDTPFYDPQVFRPYRLIALFLKAVRRVHPEDALWHEKPYEYETTRRAIDLLAGGPRLREWVDDPLAVPSDLEAILSRDESQWRKETQDLWKY